jgi:hypothetical protein
MRAVRYNSGGETARGLYATTQAMSLQLGDLAWAAFRLGDDAQRAFVDLAFDLARCSVTDVVARLSDWSEEAGEAVLTLGSGLGRTWQQGRNNFEVYGLVKDVRSRLQLDWSRPFDLNQLVERAYDLGAYADLWAVEGLGHDYAAMCLDRGVRAGILRDGPAASLPRRSFTMMHAGLGLALAERTAQALTPYARRSEFRDVATGFADACDAHAVAGYAGAAYESLGLVIRTWHPQLMSAFDEALMDVDRGLAGFFWHGAGRALYFLPTYIVPGLLSPWRAADREAPHLLAHCNLLAGLAWAMTLVNIRQPDTLAHLLSVRGDVLTRYDGFTNGICSAIVMAIDTTPDDPYVLAFAEYDPRDQKPHVRDMWRRAVRPAVVLALRRYQPVLAAHGQLERVFRCTNLDQLVDCLARGESILSARRKPPQRAATAPRSLRMAPHPGLYPASASLAPPRGGHP